MTSFLTAPQLLWQAAGEPPAKWPLELASGYCATCGVSVSEGVSHLVINTTTFSQQGDFFQYGSHCCPACAWLYSDAKRNHRSVLAIGDEIHWPLLSLDAATEQGRPSWWEVFRLVAAADPVTPVAGVLTTDPKPRFWPRMRLGTAGALSLYVHAPDHDVSNVIRFNVVEALQTIDLIVEALALGFTKASIYHGFWRDFARMTRHLVEARCLEAELATRRHSPAFVPALLAAGRRKEEKNGRPTGRPEPRRAARGGAPADGARLLQLG